MAARNEHLVNKIIPALRNKAVIICDRFTDSTLAYQVYGKKVDRNFINQIHKFILRNIKPDLTFILKVSSVVSKLRLKKRKTKNRYDNFSKSFYTKAQNSFMKIAKNKRNYVILNASHNNTDLENKILQGIMDAQEEFGVKSTPSFLINGNLVAGNKSIKDFRQIIDKILSD